MRGRKISGYAIVGAICLMLLAVTDIVRIAKYYVPYMFNGFLPYIIIQGIGTAGLIVIAIGRLAKAKTVMLSGSIAYMLCEVIFTYNSLSGIDGGEDFYGVVNLLINIFCLAAAVVLFVFILKCEKSKNLKYIWYIPAGCALFAGIFTVMVIGIGILYSEFAYNMAIMLPILFRIAGMLFIGLDLMKIGAEKKVVPNMNGVPNAAYVNNQSRTYQDQPYRAQQPMSNAPGQHVQQGNPQMQHQQMAGNTQQRYQQMPNINTAQYQQPQSNQQTQYQTTPNSAQYQQTVNNTQSQYQQTQSNAQTQYQQTSNSANAQYQQIQSSKQAQYQQMLNTNQNQQMQANAQSAEQVLTLAEELKKYKELVDAGIITQQEYEEKKKKLLGL